MASTPAPQVYPGWTHIEWIEQKCSNCLSCVVICSERHTGMSAPSRARIRVQVDLLTDNKVTAFYCRQCEDAPCAEACPEGAIAFDGTVRAWLVDDEKCMACAACVDACPYEAIQVDPVTDISDQVRSLWRLGPVCRSLRSGRTIGDRRVAWRPEGEWEGTHDGEEKRWLGGQAAARGFEQRQNVDRAIGRLRREVHRWPRPRRSNRVGRNPGGHEAFRSGKQDHLRGRPAHRHLGAQLRPCDSLQPQPTSPPIRMVHLFQLRRLLGAGVEIRRL